jgi:hypothetical protein
MFETAHQHWERNRLEIRTSPIPFKTQFKTMVMTGMSETEGGQTDEGGRRRHRRLSTVKDCNCKVQMTQFEQLGNEQQQTNEQTIEEQSPFRLVKSGRLSLPCPKQTHQNHR